MTKRLTELVCRNATSEGKSIKKISDGDGLYLWVYLNGAKYWRFRFKYIKVGKMLSLGVYPDVSLADARKETKAARRLLDDGIDPSVHRKSKTAVSKQSDLFEPVAREWYAKQLHTWTEKHGRDVLRRLEKNLFPHIGKRPIGKIDGPELLGVINIIEERGATDLAHRVNVNAGQIFRYGIATGRCKYDVAAGIVDALTPHVKRNQPSIKPDKLKKLLEDISTYHLVGEMQTQLALHVMAHTFLRTNELIGGEWPEIDFEVALWTIPGPRMKMDNDHLIPLTPQVITYLKRLKELAGSSKYIFPGRNPFKPISNNTMLFALYRLGYKGIMTGHGFRSVASTILNETGFNPDVIERQLSHVEKNEVRGAYNKAQYIRQRREMMIWWSNYIDATEADKSFPSPDFGSAGN